MTGHKYHWYRGCVQHQPLGELLPTRRPHSEIGDNQVGRRLETSEHGFRGCSIGSNQGIVARGGERTDHDQPRGAILIHEQSQRAPTDGRCHGRHRRTFERDVGEEKQMYRDTRAPPSSGARPTSACAPAGGRRNGQREGGFLDAYGVITRREIRGSVSEVADSRARIRRSPWLTSFPSSSAAMRGSKRFPAYCRMYPMTFSTGQALR
jgi:hypothetical protein